MNHLHVETFQGSTRVDHACILNDRRPGVLSPLLFLSCHDAIHGYSLESEQDGFHDVLTRAWTCTMLDRMDGLLPLPPPDASSDPDGVGSISTGSESSTTHSSERVLMLTSEAVVELYEVSPHTAVVANDPSTSQDNRSGRDYTLMELLGSCSLALPAEPAQMSSSAETSTASPTSCRNPQGKAMAHRRPEGPVWSSAVQVGGMTMNQQDETLSGSGGGGSTSTTTNTNVSMAIALLSVFDNFLHIIRVPSEGGGSREASRQHPPLGQSSERPPPRPLVDMSTMVVDLGTCGLTGTVPPRWGEMKLMKMIVKLRKCGGAWI